MFLQVGGELAQILFGDRSVKVMHSCEVIDELRWQLPPVWVPPTPVDMATLPTAADEEGGRRHSLDLLKPE
eukprot:CAMPEP_0182834150 /NCGR_PEP_ID=MMETSP0006_2-20121128/20750_1 /TAXON_ID=97485 /ORGANISM="Prymnesium parvum, Strain Texoma1" /LENGTH=70 /DNA_ID=CAMNT_0024962355 /DNA_START=175 /DNA_END=387 /DNA_ORIENTATION=+